MRISIFTILLFASIPFAADWLAVLPMTIDGSEAEVGKYLDVSDQAQLDKEIRSQFARALGKCLPVKDRAEVDELLDANYRNCKGDNCVVGVLGKIGARYGVLPSLTVSKAREELILNLELASNKNSLPLSTLSTPLGKGAGKKLFQQMPDLVKESVGFLLLEVPQCAGSIAAQTTPNVEVDEVGTNVTIELTDGPGVVLVDNRVACSNKDRCTKELSDGTHTITATRDGFRDSTFSIRVPQGNNRYALALVSKTGVLTIRAQSEDGEAVTANVVVDDRLVGQTPWSGPVAVAARSVTVRADGYRNIEVSARPNEGKKQSVTVSLERNRPKAGQGMAAIPAGCFQMGSNEGDDDEKPVHRVCLSAFSMDKYEVTQGQYKSAMGASDHTNDGTCWANNRTSNKWELVASVASGFLGDNKPALCVDWNEARRYCEKRGKRLPTEAEFEYATRAGTSTPYFWGNDPNQGCRFANGTDQTPLSNGSSWNTKMECKDGYGDAVAPVGSFQSNPWGLFDMTGNVWEWTSDWYGNEFYGQSPSQDPRGPFSGSYRVIRGGSWNYYPASLRSTNRYDGSVPSGRGTDLGFRCAL